MAAALFIAIDQRSPIYFVKSFYSEQPLYLFYVGLPPHHFFLDFCSSFWQHYTVTPHNCNLKSLSERDTYLFGKEQLLARTF